VRSWKKENARSVVAQSNPAQANFIAGKMEQYFISVHPNARVI
jgi:hypothetical protein